MTHPRGTLKMSHFKTEENFMIKAGGKNFKNKTTLTAYCKFVMNNQEKDTLLSGEWEAVMCDVLRMHEDFEEKTKGGPFKIGVRACFINPRNRQFYILRQDGTDTDFSYLKAITSKSKLSYVKETLRDAIKEQTTSYKENYFKENADNKGYVLCPETGLKIKKKESHIDHFPVQFDTIIKNWAKMQGIKSKDIALVRPPDNSTVWGMEDKGLLQSFIDYHGSVAQYRIVLNKVNLQRGKAERAKF